MTNNSESSIEVADPFARRLLAKYLERRREDLVRLRNALSQNDFASIERTGHNLFGSGGAYGLEPISDLGADLEQAAQSKDSKRISYIVDALEAFVEQVTVKP
jgi:HPt (histidine-containing phosphotransfer) domain-containing protein